MKKIQRRNINGVFLLDKDSGVSSNHALQQVKRLFNAEKAGHTGSLDPLASGVLPICFGEATKFARFLLDADKTYLVTAKLGVVTDSGDAAGNIIATNPVPNFTRQTILENINKFIGASKQVPSMFCALKHNGQPLYKLARQNITVAREARDIFIYHFELLESTYDTITCEVKCSKGTYIRSLIEDLGAMLGCGAHVTALRRTSAGSFNICDASRVMNLDVSSRAVACLGSDANEFRNASSRAGSCIASDANEFRNASSRPRSIPDGLPSGIGRSSRDPEEQYDHLLLPVESLLTGINRINLSTTDSHHIRNGRKIHLPEQLLGFIALWSDENTLLGIGEATNDGNIVPIRLVSSQLAVI